MLSLAAPAKINLYLHVLARRADGYHEIETLVAFTELADRLSVKPADTLSLQLSGPFAADAGEVDSNLVLKAARLLQKVGGSKQGAALALEKNIPVGAGLGGGSSDAAAALKALNDLWKLDLSHTKLKELAPQLGADVAMFLEGKPLIARGIGEKLEVLSGPFTQQHAVLVYPNKPLLSAQVYALLDTALAPPPGERNDLQRPAIAALPDVGEVLLALQTAGPQTELVRMSGSGSCCYALYADADRAAKAAGAIRMLYPEWWVATTTLWR